MNKAAQKRAAFARAKNCCERCGIANSLHICRGVWHDGENLLNVWYDGELNCHDADTGEELPQEALINGSFSDRKIVVRLNLAHLNGYNQDFELDNLKVLCQRCNHLRVSKLKKKAMRLGRVPHEQLDLFDSLNLSE